MTERIHIERRAEARHTGIRFDQVAVELFPDFTRARLQKWIRSGELRLEGRSERPAYRLVGNESLVLDAVPEASTEVSAQELPLNILFEDEHLLVLDKAAGMVVHPAAGNPDGTLQNAILFFDPDLAHLPRSGIVHRLDKDTSGVMVVARSLKAHGSLVAQLQERSMSRIYETVVHGICPSGGSVVAPIGRHPRARQKMAVVPGGKAAASHFTVLQHFVHFSHLKVALESGRTHQIRVHLEHLRFPLVGDPMYGRRLGRKASLDTKVRESIEGFQRQALHARTLTLLHPGHGRTMRFEAPLPSDLRSLIDTLAHHDH